METASENHGDFSVVLLLVLSVRDIPQRHGLQADNGGIDRHGTVRMEIVPFTVNLFPAASKHPAVTVQPVPFFIVLQPAGDGLAVFHVLPGAAVVLHPALGGLRVNDDFHEPPQDSSDFGAGGGSFRVKTVAAFPSQDARLLHGFDFLCRPAADLRVVRKGHSFMGSRQVIAQLFRVICHNDRHLFPGDIGVRGKGGGGCAVYDDRDVIITNLLETYDRLIAFGQKHLSDPFVQEGIQSISARDWILREIFSNSLAHRDYSSGYVAKFVIERNRLYTENANRSHGHGELLLSSFEPYAKNPPISKVFREIGLADELGSGMRNTYKYTRLYSGGTPEFIEDDVFRTIVPLAPVAIEKVGPQEKTQVTTQVKTQVTITDKILVFCLEPHSKAEIAEHCGYKNTKNFTQKYLRPLLDTGKLQMTIPDKPRSQNQKYITSER